MMNINEMPGPVAGETPATGQAANGGRASRPTEPTGRQDARPPIPTGGQDACPPIPTGGQDACPPIPTGGQDACPPIPTGGQDARPPRGATAPKGYYRRGEKHPPHMDHPEKMQHVIFRLAGSMPAEYLARIKHAFASGSLTDEEYRATVEAKLDEGHGPTWLSQREIAEVVQNALEYFDGDRYDLHTWSIMPNHVHVLMRPREGNSLPNILHSWKSLTAKKCNAILGRSGAFWQDDYFDRYMRDYADVVRTAAYILNNRGWTSHGNHASLEDQPPTERHGSSGCRASRPTEPTGGQDARPPIPIAGRMLTKIND